MRSPKGFEDTYGAERPEPEDDASEGLTERLVWVVEQDGAVHTSLQWLPPDLKGGLTLDGRVWLNASLEFP